MKVIYDTSVMEYANDESSINKILADIESKLDVSNDIFSHLEIDNDVVCEEFENYISKHINDIKKINVIVKTYDDFVKEVLDTTSDFLSASNTEIEKLADEFYKTPKADDWKKLASLLESISWILESYEMIAQNSNKISGGKSWSQYTKQIIELKEILSELFSAMDSDDRISIADLLLYEIASIFNNMKEILVDLDD